MIKLVLMLRKKPGTTREQFVDYYENRHVPLIKSYVGQYMHDYKRNYIDWSSPISAAMLPQHRHEDGEPGFDVVTEIWIRDEATMAAMFARAQEPGIAEAIYQDELNCFDKTASKRFQVQEYPQ